MSNPNGELDFDVRAIDGRVSMLLTLSALGRGDSDVRIELTIAAALTLSDKLCASVTDAWEHLSAENEKRLRTLLPEEFRYLHEGQWPDGVWGTVGDSAAATRQNHGG